MYSSFSSYFSTTIVYIWATLFPVDICFSEGAHSFLILFWWSSPTNFQDSILHYGKETLHIMSIFRLVPSVSCKCSYWLSHHLSAVIIKKIAPLIDNIICQCGKGRDVGLNQIAAFEGKEASGNGEQTLSRDIYRCGQLFDFFRMLSFFFTSVGYYLTTMVGTFISSLLLFTL